MMIDNPLKSASLYCAIDIGTVTTRMLLATLEGDSITELKRDHVITNLGVGVDQSGLLTDDGIHRVREALRGFIAKRDRIMANYGFKTSATMAVATSAARDAKNAQYFQSEVEALGIPIMIIEGWQEGRLTYGGVAADFSGEALGVLDIGGGSTEFIVGDCEISNKYADPLELYSFNIGSRRLTERFLKNDPPTPVEYEALHWASVETLEPRLKTMLTSAPPLQRLVAVAGTATSVVSVRDGMDPYDPTLVHRAIVTREELREVIDRLSPLSAAKRAQVRGLEPPRAPVIVAGMMILDAVLELGDFDSFTVSESDLLQGLVRAISRRGASKDTPLS